MSRFQTLAPFTLSETTMLMCVVLHTLNPVTYLSGGRGVGISVSLRSVLSTYWVPIYQCYIVRPYLSKREEKQLSLLRVCKAPSHGTATENALSLSAQRNNSVWTAAWVCSLLNSSSSLSLLNQPAERNSPGFLIPLLCLPSDNIRVE